MKLDAENNQRLSPARLILPRQALDHTSSVLTHFVFVFVVVFFWFSFSFSVFWFAQVIVAAGMEGALPSVVAGLVDSPVIAVPTSVG